MFNFQEATKDAEQQARQIFELLDIILKTQI